MSSSRLEFDLFHSAFRIYILLKKIGGLPSLRLIFVFFGWNPKRVFCRSPSQSSPTGLLSQTKNNIFAQRMPTSGLQCAAHGRRRRPFCRKPIREASRITSRFPLLQIGATHRFFLPLDAHSPPPPPLSARDLLSRLPPQPPSSSPPPPTKMSFCASLSSSMEKRKMRTEREGIEVEKRDLERKNMSLKRDQWKLVDGERKLREGQKRLLKDQEKLRRDQDKLAEDQGKLAQDQDKLAQDREKLAKDQEKLAEDQGKLAEDQEKLRKDGDSKSDDMEVDPKAKAQTDDDDDLEDKIIEDDTDEFARGGAPGAV